MHCAFSTFAFYVCRANHCIFSNIRTTVECRTTKAFASPHKYSACCSAKATDAAKDTNLQFKQILRSIFIAALQCEWHERNINDEVTRLIQTFRNFDRIRTHLNASDSQSNSIQYICDNQQMIDIDNFALIDAKISRKKYIRTNLTSSIKS